MNLTMNYYNFGVIINLYFKYLQKRICAIELNFKVLLSLKVFTS